MGGTPLEAGTTILGLETEYGLASIDEAGARPLNKEMAYDWLRLAIKERHRALGDGGGGLFLENGARFYLDAGKHPELALPEVTDPREVVRYDRAGERLLARSAQRASAHGGPPISFLKTNICYHSGQTYGCHENYLVCRDFDEIAPGLIPFLVTRQLFCGAGRISPRGEGFELSQRAVFLVRVSAPDITGTAGGRAIFCTKDESLMDGRGWKRLHLICGDSLRSELGTYLKVGTTALVLKALEGNAGSGQAVSLSDPLRALNQVSQDLFFGQPVLLENGQRWTALQIQRYYWKLVRMLILEGGAPPWSTEVWKRWGWVLDRLEKDTRPLSLALDAHIKLALYSHYLRRRGVGWSQVRSDQGLFQDLCVLDVHYGRLGGLFDQLEEKGALDHQILGPEEIEAAIEQPPVDTRAALRGSWIREICRRRNPSDFVCNWTGILDLSGKKSLNLQDPFCTRAEWRDFLDESEDPEEPPLEQWGMIRRLMGRRA